MTTRNERREQRRTKARSHRVSGASVRLLWRLIIEKAKRLREAHNGDTDAGTAKT